MCVCDYSQFNTSWTLEEKDEKVWRWKMGEEEDSLKERKIRSVCVRVCTCVRVCVCAHLVAF